MIQLKQLIPKDYCLNCQGCCRYAQEDSIWLPHLLVEEQKRLSNIRALADPQQGNFICTFLNKESNKCRIYHLRPFECQLYPFVFNRNSKKIFLAVDPNCAFMKTNPRDQEFKDYVQRLADLINSPSGINILKNNPQLIQAYEGVLALAEIDI